MKKILILALMILFPLTAFALEEISDAELDTISSYGLDAAVLSKMNLRQLTFGHCMAAFDLRDTRNLIGMTADNIVERYQATMEMLFAPAAKVDIPMNTIMAPTFTDIDANVMMPTDWQVEAVHATVEIPLTIAPGIVPITPVVGGGFTYVGTVSSALH